MIQTFEFEGAPDMVNIEYMWFEDLGDGRSRLRGRSICPNIEARDALLSSGMEGGMTEGYERLDALLVPSDRLDPRTSPAPQKGVAAGDVNVLDDRDGGTMIELADPDGNAWVVQQDQGAGGDAIAAQLNWVSA